MQVHEVTDRTRLAVAERDRLVVSLMFKDGTELPSIIMFGTPNGQALDVIQTDDLAPINTLIRVRWEQVKEVRILGAWVPLYRGFDKHLRRIDTQLKMYDLDELGTMTLEQWVDAVTGKAE